MIELEEPLLEQLKRGPLPTEDDLPYSDGEPMESSRHLLQMVLLRESLSLYWSGRDDFCVGTNMFLYYSPDQVLNREFLGPDVFVALNVPRRDRKSWVSWVEGKVPDLVIELLSESTEARDRDEKKRIYQDKIRVPEYFWFDMDSPEWKGFRLECGVYQPIPAEAQERRLSRKLGLVLGPWEGPYEESEGRWLRWFTPDGTMLPTNAEMWKAQAARTEQERQRAEEARLRADQEHSRAEQERERAERLAARLRALGIDPDEGAL